MDPVEIRMKNVITDGVDGHTQSPLPSPVTMDQVIEECAAAGGWTKQGGKWVHSELPQPSEVHLKSGTGFGCGYKNVGFSYGFPERNWTTVELHGKTEIERVVVHQAGSDVGQGAHTLYRQIAAEALGVPLEIVELAVADTAITGDSGSTSASRMTYMAGNAIIGAAKLALTKWRDEERPAIAEFKYVPTATTPLEHGTGKSENPNVAYGYVAQVVELEVDTETGEVRLLRVCMCRRCWQGAQPPAGRGSNRGGSRAGRRLCDDGELHPEGWHILTDKLSTYLIPTILDIPEKVDSLILEYADKKGPFGARGMAEMPYIPLAPAITAAFHQATGVWVDEFPLTPERVLRALGKI